VAGLSELRDAAARCTRCDLYRNATQTVFGEGEPHARLVLIGEQPGDREDVEGRPFVGPAGQLLDRALAAAGIERRQVYLTNAVKHFKWKRQGKVRLHQKPNAEEIRACADWWRAELDAVQPDLVVLLGATAGWPPPPSEYMTMAAAPSKTLASLGQPLSFVTMQSTGRPLSLSSFASSMQPPRCSVKWL